MASPKDILSKASKNESDDIDYSAAEARKEDRLMDEKMTPAQLLQDIKDDLDLLVRKLKAGK